MLNERHQNKPQQYQWLVLLKIQRCGLQFNKKDETNILKKQFSKEVTQIMQGINKEKARSRIKIKQVKLNFKNKVF